MSNASYERQHLATHAAGSINAAGTTAISFGCQMTRIAEGHYGLILDADNGVIDDETFTQVQIKGVLASVASVVDTSNRVKTIRTFDAGGSVTGPDIGIEVILYKSVTRPSAASA